MRCFIIFVVVLFIQFAATVPVNGQLLDGIGGGGGLLGGLGGLGNVGNTLTKVTGGLSNLSKVTKSLSSVTSVASNLVQTVTKTVTHLTAATSQVTQLAGTLSKLTATATGLPATVLKFTKTIGSAFTTVTQVVTEASSVLGQSTTLVEAIAKIQRTTHILVKHLNTPSVDVTIVQKSVTNVVTSIKYFISVAHGYIGDASKSLSNSSILPVGAAVGKILVSMQSVLEIVSSTISTVQTVTQTTSTTTIIKTTVEKIRGLVQNYTNQISNPSVIPSLLESLLGHIGGISSAFPAQLTNQIGPGNAGVGTPIQPQSEINPGPNNGANGQNQQLNGQQPDVPHFISSPIQTEHIAIPNKGGPTNGNPNQGDLNSLNNLPNEQFIAPGQENGAPIQTPTEGYYNGPDNSLNGNYYPSQGPQSSPNNLSNGQYIPSGPGVGTPNQTPNQGYYNGPNNILNGNYYPSQGSSNSPQSNSNITPNGQYIPSGLGDGTPIQTPNQGYNNGPDNTSNENYYPSQGPQSNSNNLQNGQYIPSGLGLNGTPNQTPDQGYYNYYPSAQTYPDNDLQQHSFWNYPVILAQPDSPTYQSTNIGNQGPSQAGYWEGPSGGQQNSGPQITNIGGSYQPNEEAGIAPISEGGNQGYPNTENYQTNSRPNYYPNNYSQSPDSPQFQKTLPPSQQTFSNLAGPQNIGPVSGNYPFPSQTSGNYPLAGQTSNLSPAKSGIIYPTPSSISGSYPISDSSLPTSSSSPSFSSPLSGSYPLPSQTLGNYPSIDQPSYSVPENSGNTFPSGNYPFPIQTSENYPSTGQSLYPVPQNSGINYPSPATGSYPAYPISGPSLPSTLTSGSGYQSPIGPGYPGISATAPTSLATSSASASPGHATASAAATSNNLGNTPAFSGPSTSISIFRKYEIALRGIFAQILQIIASLQGLPTDQLTFAVRRIYATIHTLMLFVSQLNNFSARSQNSVDIIFNTIKELSGNLQDLVRLVKQILANQGNSTSLLRVLKLATAVTAVTINQVQQLAQQLDTNAANFLLQSSIDRVLLNLINVYGQLYPGSYNGQLNQPNGVDDLFNNLSTNNQSYKPIYHGISHSVVQVIQNIIQQAAQTIQSSDNDYNQLLNTLQSLPLNQDQISQITNLMSQMYNNLNTVSYRLESIDNILKYVSGYGHVGNFDQYSTVTQSTSSASASSTSNPDGIDTSSASASSSSTTVTAPYSQVVDYAGPFAQNLLNYSGIPTQSS